jgi:hypothetical protein
MKHFYDFDEEWRPVVGVAHYEVSSLGVVRSVDRTILCADGRTRSFKGQIIRGTHDRRMGYHRVVLWDRARPIARTVHSLIAEAFIGPCPPGQEVRHKNGDSSDNRAVNLEYGTRSQTLLDASRHGTHPATARKGKPITRKKVTT